MKNKLFSSILVFILLMNMFIFNILNVTAEMVEPNIFGEYAVTIDASSGEVLYDKNANEKAFPASITKVLTALLLVENIKENEVIEMSDYCAGIERSGSQIVHSAGEKFDRDTALRAMLVTSANDIACSIGEHISGSEEAFGKLMTERAKELGAKNSQFFTASGLHHPAHQTTAYDMALVGREAIKHDIILEGMGMKTYIEKTSEQTKEVVNPSKIHDDPDSLGGKTGFTNAARNTLMKIDEVDGKRVINVVMRSNLANVYQDIKSISDYGIDQLQSELVVDKTNWSETLTFLEKQVIVRPEKNVYLTKKKTDNDVFNIAFKQTKEFDDSYLYLEGIKKDEKIGEIEISKNGEIVSNVDVLSTQDVFFEEKKQSFFPFWLKVIMAVVAPILAYIGFVIVYNYKQFNKNKKPV